MPTLKTIRASNARIRTALPTPLTAVFIGATNGIGATTLKQFALATPSPRVYFTGRSEPAGNAIAAECRAANPNGTFTFIPSDTSLLANVDAICRSIAAKEKHINLLFLSTGTFASSKTAEGLHLPISVVLYSRNRFILNLLPLLQAAPGGPGGLKRVVTCFTGTKEGPINWDDVQGWKVPMTQAIKQRGHVASLVTLSLEALAKKAPDVSFIHDFPGPVKTGIGREMKGWVMGTMKVFFSVAGTITGAWIPIVESGERHLFLGTSGMFPAVEGRGDGVPMEEGMEVARGVDGVPGSGVYSVDEKGESAGAKVEELLAGMRKEGGVERVWGDTEERFKEILGGVEGV